MVLSQCEHHWFEAFNVTHRCCHKTKKLESLQIIIDLGENLRVSSSLLLTGASSNTVWLNDNPVVALVYIMSLCLLASFTTSLAWNACLLTKPWDGESQNQGKKTLKLPTTTAVAAVYDANTPLVSGDRIGDRKSWWPGEISHRNSQKNAEIPKQKSSTPTDPTGARIAHLEAGMVSLPAMFQTWLALQRLERGRGPGPMSLEWINEFNGMINVIN